MNRLSLIIVLFIFVGCSKENVSRELKMVSFSGTGYELGFQHGSELKNEIADVVEAWKMNVNRTLNKDANSVVSDFFEYASFDESIKKWTPDLFEEVRGIAEGSGQNFNDIFVLNLLDEFWVYIDNLNNHHCSGMGIPSMNGNPGYLSQNMDLETYMDCFQMVMRIDRTEDRPEQLILTHPGLIALNGLNKEGIGVCVNTIMQLQASSTGLPVAFVIRRILNSSDKDEVLKFIQNISHASGQNYIIGIKGEVFDFEASANKVVRYNPENENGTVYHTNHPSVNDDTKPWVEETMSNLSQEDLAENYNTHLRFKSVEKRIANANDLTESTMIAALRSRDNKENPVCRTRTKRSGAFTFASTIMTMTEQPYLQLTVGPPDESEFIRIDFREE